MEPAGVAKDTQFTRSKSSMSSKHSQNQNPNLTSSPALKSSNSPSNKSGSKNLNPNGFSALLNNRIIRERKFVVAKKSKRTDRLNQSTAYEKLRASHEDFFKNHVVENDFDNNEGLIPNPVIGEGCKGKVDDRNEGLIRKGCDKVEECGTDDEVRKSVPEPGSGRVMGLIKAFEKMKMEKSNENDEKKWGLPGLEDPPNVVVVETQLSSSSFCPSDLFLTSECLGLDSRRSSSLDSNRLRKSYESNGEFARRQWRKRQQLKTTTKPFKLRTEERGKCKEEEFMKKIQQMKEEEEKLRVPIAQGLPWTTDEPECLAKPPIKEATKPIDLVLHSDVRAEERAEFDHQVAEKMSFIEQYRMERERQQNLAEEEQIKRLRKELVPKAQPMPYFDRPFIPRRSEKQPTIPKEPKFHLAQNKKIKCMQQSWSDTSSYISISDTCDRL